MKAFSSVDQRGPASPGSPVILRSEYVPAVGGMKHTDWSMSSDVKGSVRRPDGLSKRAGSNTQPGKRVRNVDFCYETFRLQDGVFCGFGPLLYNLVGGEEADEVPVRAASVDRNVSRMGAKQISQEEGLRYKTRRTGWGELVLSLWPGNLPGYNIVDAVLFWAQNRDRERRQGSNALRTMRTLICWPKHRSAPSGNKGADSDFFLVPESSAAGRAAHWDSKIATSSGREGP
jgi:hypothetical protein